jgi:hypothetical protein
MTRDPTKCAHCGADLALHTELRKQLCQQEFLKTLMKKWAIIALGIFCMASFFLPPIVFAQQSQTQLFGQDGNPIALSNQNPDVITSLHSGDFVRGHTTEIVAVTGTVANLMTSTGLQGTDFTFVVPSYQSSVQVGQQTFVIIPAQDSGFIPEWVETNAGYFVGMAVIGTLLAGIVSWLRRGRRANRRWRN